MTVDMLRAALGWCSIINIGFLLWWFLWLAFAHDLVYRLHGKWFQLPKGDFDRIHYGALAYFKLTVIIFNVVPYFALCIIG